MIDFLDKLTEKKNEGTMSNRILSMYEIMKSASEEGSVRKERPYSNILVPMMENETELRNELADLKDSISDIMKTVIEFQDMNSFGQFIMKNEMLDRFFSEYFFVKNKRTDPDPAFLSSVTGSRICVMGICMRKWSKNVENCRVARKSRQFPCGSLHGGTPVFPECGIRRKYGTD